MDQQTKHLTTLIILGCALLAAGIAALHAIFFHDAAQELAGAEEHRLLHFSRKDVDVINVKAGASNTVLKFDVEQSGRTEWLVVSPILDAANDAAVYLILDALEKVSWSERFTGDEASPEKFGLDKPAAEVSILLSGSGSGGSRHKIRVGSIPAIDGTDYVSVDDGKDVFKTSTPLRFALEKKVQDLRNKRIIYFKSRTISLIQVFDGQKKIYRQVRKREDGIWNIGKPLATRADAVSVQKMLDNLDNFLASEVVAERLSITENRELFSVPFFRLKVTHKDLSFEELIFAIPNGEEGSESGESRQLPQSIQDAVNSLPKKLLVRRADSPRIYRINGDLLAPFFQSAQELRDWNAISIDTSETAALMMEFPDGKVILREGNCPTAGDEEEIRKCQKSPPWYIDGPIEKPVPYERVQRIIGSLLRLRAAEFWDGPHNTKVLEAHGLTSPVRTWTFFNRKGKAQVSLSEAEPSQDGSVWFYSVDPFGETLIFSVYPNKVAELPRNASDIESATWGF